MDSPVGLSSDIFLPIQEKLAKLTKVCVYDRAGLGLSERPIDPKEPNNNATKKARIHRGQDFTIGMY